MFDSAKVEQTESHMQALQLQMQVMSLGALWVLSQERGFRGRSGLDMAAW